MARQKFGGDWTEDKLVRVSEYLQRYNTALKNQPIHPRVHRRLRRHRLSGGRRR